MGICMFKLFSALLIGFSMAFLTGCFNDKQPSDTEITKMATAYFNQQNPSLFVATQVTKLNGYKQNETHYVAELDITSEAKQSLSDYASAMTQDPSLSAFEKMAMSMQLGIMKLTLPDFKAGDAIQWNKSYLFIKTDNGWMLKEELTEQN